MIKADVKYNGVVRGGSALTETQSGTVAFQVQLHCEDGDTSFMIWMTPKNKERAQKYFTDSLDVPLEHLRDPNYFDYQLAQDIEGREVSFGTKAEEYNGKTTVKVSWIGKKSESVGGSLSKAASRFFGASITVDAKAEDLTADEIPF
jgi:hypothetical protein